MEFFNTYRSRILAAVSSLAFSAVFFAVAIAPANHGVLLPGVVA